MSKTTRKIFKDFRDIAEDFKEREAEELKTALEGPDIEALRAKVLTAIQTEGLTEAHTAYQEKLQVVGKIVEELFSQKGELKMTLNGIGTGQSPAKSRIFDQIAEINEKIQSLYKTMPGLREHVEYEFRIRQATQVEHFGHLNSLLQKLVEEGRAEEQPGMSFKEARGKFPRTTIIMYGKAAYVVKGFRLGRALIEARLRCVTEAESSQG